MKVVDTMEVDFPFGDEEFIEQSQDRRMLCERCRRAVQTCICEYFPDEPVSIRTTIHMLQHPREHDFRSLTTVPLLQECVPKSRCIIYRGKRFSANTFSELHAICKQTNTLCLYPSIDAVDISEYGVESGAESGATELAAECESRHLVVIDGTWKQARQIYFNNKFLHSLTKVRITGDWKSTYVIRTQPSNDCLSTLEATAIAIAQLERIPKLLDVVRRPLKALCDVQLAHGAVYHHSKEELLSLGIKYRVFTKENMQKLNALCRANAANKNNDEQIAQVDNLALETSEMKSSDEPVCVGVT